jgi:hypothetical protein
MHAAVAGEMTASAKVLAREMAERRKKIKQPKM